LWTMMLMYLLLWPSEGTAVMRISLFFGGTELSDAMGHIILIFIETNLSFNLLLHYFSKQRAIHYAFWCTLIFALTLETLQMFIPGRGASLIDYGANALGVTLAVIVITKQFYVSD